jgi:GMP synthase (glutamine-hydrolysing)
MLMRMMQQLSGDIMNDVKAFIQKQCDEIRHTVNNEKALIAVSGGVDSTTCAMLTHKAMGNNLQCIFIDTGFMRLNEPKGVESFFNGLNLPFKIIDAQQKFLEAIKGIEDAEEKRKRFRMIFYKTLGETAKNAGCKFLIQGTIAPDWIETKGRIKTQHNVLNQIGINPKVQFGFNLIEPLAYLYKDQVRDVARELKIKTDFSERQPFPGPGLLVRVVGKVTKEKLDIEKRATTVVEENFTGDQYFAAIIDDEVEKNNKIPRTVAKFFDKEKISIDVKVSKNNVTGVKGDLRAYKKLALLTVKSDSNLFKPPIKKLVELQVDIISNNHDFTRVAYNVTETPRNGKYIILLRSVTTRDFMSTGVTEIPWNVLIKTANKIMEDNKEVSAVYYDVTPKPPATVEYE